jgi:hypothetical protein
MEEEKIMRRKLKKKEKQTNKFSLRWKNLLK